MTWDATIASDKYLVLICGPTASGKTGASLDLARHYRTEILSFDSRQLFREMRIGTARPPAAALEEIPHHFIGSHSIHDNFSAGQFETEAIACLDNLFTTRDIVIAVGGTGLYMTAITDGLDDIPKPTPEIREALQREFREQGLKHLQELAMEADPEACARTDMQNPHRLFRIVEVFRVSGKPISFFRKHQPVGRRFRSIKIGMDVPRDVLYQRINRRAEQMIEDGLLDEVRGLYPHRNLNALHTVGYTELFDYIDGGILFSETLEAIRRNTRRYAKRQLTWFRRDPAIAWIPPHKWEDMVDYIDQKMLP